MVSIVHGYYVMWCVFIFNNIYFYCYNVTLLINVKWSLYFMCDYDKWNKILKMCTHNHLFTKVHKNQHGIRAWYWLLPWPAQEKILDVKQWTMDLTLHSRAWWIPPSESTIQVLQWCCGLLYFNIRKKKLGYI